MAELTPDLRRQTTTGQILEAVGVLNPGDGDLYFAEQQKIPRESRPLYNDMLISKGVITPDQSKFSLDAQPLIQDQLKNKIDKGESTSPDEVKRVIRDTYDLVEKEGKEGARKKLIERSEIQGAVESHGQKAAEASKGNRAESFADHLLLARAEAHSRKNEPHIDQQRRHA